MSPARSFPTANATFESKFLNSLDSISSRKCTIVLSLFGDTPKEALGADFCSTVPFGNIKAKDVLLTPEATGEDLAKMAAFYSDGIIMGSADVAPSLVDYCKGLDVPVLDCDPAALSDGSYANQYNEFYDLLQ